MIHSFARVPLGFAPYGGLVQDARGDLYGTTNNGGGNGVGSVYKLTHGQSGWIMTALVEFRHNDGNGYSPAARLTLGPDGAFYGTTAYGGSHACGNGCGTIFRLNPTGLGRTVIYRFSDPSDGYLPLGALVSIAPATCTARRKREALEGMALSSNSSVMEISGHIR